MRWVPHHARTVHAPCNITPYAYQDVHVWSALLTCMRPNKLGLELVFAGDQPMRVQIAHSEGHVAIRVRDSSANGWCCGER